MSQTQPLSKRGQLGFGAIFVAAGLGIMVMITVSPEGLNAPYWVAMVAAATFSFAGASIMAQAMGWDGFTRFFGLVTVFSLAMPGLWILFDPAEKACTGSIGFGGISLGANSGDLVCRAVFGFGGGITLLFALGALFVYLRQLLRRRREEAAGRD